MQDARRRYLRESYTGRVNAVIDYVEANVGRELSLEELAGVAHFSPFHFHRIFRAMVGETLNGFIQRIRIERAAAKLVHNPKESITEIAFECGFSSASAFARAFKEAFHMSASEWRGGGYRCDSKERAIDGKKSQADGKMGQDFDLQVGYAEGVRRRIWRLEMKEEGLEASIEVKDMPEFHVAYVRHVGPYKGDEALFASLFGRLMAWAEPRGLLGLPGTRLFALYHDDPDITDETRLRTDACITVPAETVGEGEIGRTTIPGGTYAVAHFEIGPDEYEAAWDAVYGGWLPESGYQPGDGPCYELFLGGPEEHPEGKHIVDICVPVKAL